MIEIDDANKGLEILKEKISNLYDSKKITGYGGLALESIDRVELPKFMESSVDYLKDVNELIKKLIALGEIKQSPIPACILRFLLTMKSFKIT